MQVLGQALKSPHSPSLAQSSNTNAVSLGHRETAGLRHDCVRARAKCLSKIALPRSPLQVTFSEFVYALTYEYTRSLAPCVLAHAIHNLSVTAYVMPYLMI